MDRMTREEAEACIRQEAEPHGLVLECMEHFERYLEAGLHPEQAVWAALYDWDI